MKKSALFSACFGSQIKAPTEVLSLKVVYLKHIISFSQPIIDIVLKSSMQKQRTCFFRVYKMFCHSALKGL
jgi:hypothetical protein